MCWLERDAGSWGEDFFFKWFGLVFKMRIDAQLHADEEPV